MFGRVTKLRHQIKQAEIAGADPDFIQRLHKELNEVQRKLRQENNEDAQGKNKYKRR